MRRTLIGLALATVVVAGAMVTMASTPSLTAAVTAPPPPDSMAALGDSITAAYNACGRFRDCPERSWSTGTDDGVNSHYLRLLAINPDIRDHAYNFAESGARAEHMPAQARGAVEAGADYVTVLVGANDVCRETEAEMTSTTQFRAYIDEALAVLREGVPRVRVFVSSIPDVHRLWEVEHADRVAQLIWWVGGVCQTMLDAPTSNSDASIGRRSRVRNRVVELNDELRHACAEFGPNCRFDGEAVFEHRFTGGAISSWDHFHPSGSGQAALAAVTSNVGFSWL